MKNDPADLALIARDLSEIDISIIRGMLDSESIVYEVARGSSVREQIGPPNPADHSYSLLVESDQQAEVAAWVTDYLKQTRDENEESASDDSVKPDSTRRKLKTFTGAFLDWVLPSAWRTNKNQDSRN